MHVLIACKNEEDPNKNEVARVATTFLPLEINGDFSSRSRTGTSAVRSRIWPNFELIRDFRVVLVNCKNEDDPNKNKGAISLFVDFLAAQV